MIQVHPHFLPHLLFSAYLVQENVVESGLDWVVEVFKVNEGAASNAYEHVGVEKCLHVSFWGTKCLILADLAGVDLEMEIATCF